MPAPKGNQFWKARTTYGTEKLFESPESLWNAACEYFQWCEDNPLWEDKSVVQQGVPVEHTVARIRAMTISGLCLFLGTTQQTLINYGSKEGYEDYFEIVDKVKEVIRDQKFSGAAAGLLNANIIARDLGLRDATDHTSSDGSMSPKPTTIELVAPDE